MTVHMIRLTTAENSTLKQWIGTWLTNMQAWTEADNRPPTTTETIEGGTTFMTADWRFAWSESKAVLLDNLTAYAQAYTAWGVIEYHECSHDADEPTPCSMQTEAEWGSIPEGV